MTEEEIDEKYNHDLNDLLRRHRVSEEEYAKEKKRIEKEYLQAIKEKKIPPEEIEQKHNNELNDLTRRHGVLEEEYERERDRIGREYEEGIKQLNTKKVRVKAKSALKKEETKMTPEEIEQEFNKKLDELIAQKGNLQDEEWEKKRQELRDWRKEEEKKAALEPESKTEEEKKMTPEEATEELKKVLGYPDEFDKIRELIKAGANVNTQTKYGLTLLYAICAPSGKNTPEEKKAAKELFMELLNHEGINPNLPNTDDGDLPLGAAVLSQDFNYVRALAEHGANFLAPLSKTTNWPYSSWEELLLDKFKRDKNAIAFIQETIKKQKEAAEKAETKDETIVPHEEGKKMTPEEALKKLKDLYKDQNSARDDETKKVKLEDVRNLVSLLDNSTINQTIYHDTYDVMLGDLAIDFGNEELFKLLDEKGFDWKKQQENARISIGAALSGNETSLLYLAEKGLLNLDETDLDEKETAQDIIKKRFSNSDDLLKRISEVEKSSEADVVEEEGKPAAEPAPDPEPTPEPSPEPEPTPEPSSADGGTPPPETPVPPENGGEEEEHDGDEPGPDDPEDDGTPDENDPNAEEEDNEIDTEKLNIQEGILGFWKEIEKTNPELYESLGRPAEMFDHPELAEEKRKAMFEAFQRDPELVKKYKDTVSKILETDEGKEIFQRIFKDRTGNVSMDDIINTLTGNGNSSESRNNETNQPAPKSGPGLGKRLGDALKGATDGFFKNVFEQNFNTAEEFAQAFLFNLLAYPLDAANILLTKEYTDDEKGLLKKILNEMKNKNNGGRDGRDGRGGGERGPGGNGPGGGYGPGGYGPGGYGQPINNVSDTIIARLLDNLDKNTNLHADAEKVFADMLKTVNERYTKLLEEINKNGTELEKQRLALEKEKETLKTATEQKKLELEKEIKEKEAALKEKELAYKKEMAEIEAKREQERLNVTRQTAQSIIQAAIDSRTIAKEEGDKLLDAIAKISADATRSLETNAKTLSEGHKLNVDALNKQTDALAQTGERVENMIKQGADKAESITNNASNNAKDMTDNSVNKSTEVTKNTTDKAAETAQKGLSTVETLSNNETEKKKIDEEEKTKRELEQLKVEQAKIEAEAKAAIQKAESEAQKERIKADTKIKLAEIQKKEKEIKAGRILAKGEIYASPQNGGKAPSSSTPPPKDGKGGNGSEGNEKSPKDELNLPKNSSKKVKDAINSYYDKIKKEGTKEQVTKFEEFINGQKEADFKQLADALTLNAKHPEVLASLRLTEQGELNKNDLKKKDVQRAFEGAGLDINNTETLEKVKKSKTILDRLDKLSEDGKGHPENKTPEDVDKKVKGMRKKTSQSKQKQTKDESESPTLREKFDGRPSGR